MRYYDAYGDELSLRLVADDIGNIVLEILDHSGMTISGRNNPAHIQMNFDADIALKIAKELKKLAKRSKKGE